MTRLEYLVSNVRLGRADGTSVPLADQVFLVNPLEDRSALALKDVPAQPWASLAFRVGLEEKTNHSDPARRATGSPLNILESNLHWGWKGGYVFLATEGYVQAPGVAAKAATEVPASFLYHLGNDWNVIEVEVPLPPTSTNLENAELAFHVDKLWSAEAPVRVGGGEVLTHSAKGDDLASRLARNLTRCFEVRRRGQ